MYPRKGAIAVGSDADLVGIDVDLERRVDVADLYTWSDFSPWEGEVLRGWPLLTVRRGEVVAERHRLLIDGGGGRYVGPPPQAATSPGDALGAAR
jgi:dihydroorotase-like cyclic amidohydrolase